MDNLRAAGLSYYESRALGHILRSPLTAKEVSRDARIPLGKVYSVLGLLAQKQLIRIRSGRPVTYYVDQPSSVIGDLLHRKRRNDEEIAAGLRNWATELDLVSAKTPRFLQVGISAEEQAQVQMRVFTEAKQEVCQLLTSQHSPGVNRLSKQVFEDAIVAAVKRKVLFRAVYPLGVMIPALLRSLPSDSFSVRRGAQDFVRCDVIDRQKVLIKLANPTGRGYCSALFLENEKLAAQLQDVFEEIWAKSDAEQ